MKNKREALSRERILKAALAIVDREGLEAISMRKVGEALGVEAMSLYNHVPSKAAILDGLYETVLAELPPARRASSWPAALKERARALRAVFRAHPSVLPVFATRPAVTPGSIKHLEGVLEVLRSAGFSADVALSTVQVLLAFVVGHSLSSYSPAVDGPNYESLSEDEFPRVREVARILGDHDLEKELEFGLDAMVRGIDAQRAKARRAKK